MVGVVTNNNDPEQRGRVRVKYPSLSDTERVGVGARRDASAGNARGLLMLPQVDEEVVIGFEHGDSRRPIVARLDLQRQGQAGAGPPPEP